MNRGSWPLCLLFALSGTVAAIPGCGRTVVPDPVADSNPGPRPRRMVQAEDDEPWPDQDGKADGSLYRPGQVLFNEPEWMSAQADLARLWPLEDHLSEQRFIGIRTNPATRKSFLVTYAKFKAPSGRQDNRTFVLKCEGQDRMGERLGRAYTRIDRASLNLTQIHPRTKVSMSVRHAVFVVYIDDRIGICQEDPYPKEIVKPTRSLNPRNLPRLLNGEPLLLHNQPLVLDERNGEDRVIIGAPRWINARLNMASLPQRGWKEALLVAAGPPIQSIDDPAILEPFKATGGKWGIRDLVGDVKIEPVFDEIPPDDFAASRLSVRVRYEGLWGVVSLKTQKIQIHPQFLEMAVLSEQKNVDLPSTVTGYAVRDRTDGKWAIADAEGKHSAFDFVEVASIPFRMLSGLLRDSTSVQVRTEPDGKWAIADFSGKVRTPHHFDRIVRSAGGDYYVTRATGQGLNLVRSSDGVAVASRLAAVNDVYSCGSLGAFAMAKNAAGEIGCIQASTGKWRGADEQFALCGDEWNRQIANRKWSEAGEVAAFIERHLSAEVGYDLGAWSSALGMLNGDRGIATEDGVYGVLFESQKLRPHPATERLLSVFANRRLIREFDAQVNSFKLGNRIDDAKWKELKSVIAQAKNSPPVMYTAFHMMTEEYKREKNLAADQAREARARQEAQEKFRAEKDAFWANTHRYWEDFNRNSADNRFKAWVSSGNSQRWRIVPE